VDSETGSIVEVKPFPSREVSTSIACALIFASTLSSAAALWQHTSASAVASLVETSSHGLVSATVGGAAVALAWIPVFLVTVACLAILIMVLAVIILDRLTDND
jgi:hypothetical protein